MFENEPDLLTRKQAQQLLHIGKNTMLNYIYSQAIPVSVIANSYRIRKEDLIEFIEKSSVYR